MNYTAEKISSNRTKLTFRVSAEAFEGAMQQAYLKLRKRISVPGFRKGKAPRKLIERMYGEATFYEDAFDAIFPDAYREAVEKEDMHPVGQPEIDLEQIGSGQELKFTAEVYVRPDVTLGEYKGLKAERLLPAVTDEAIDARIERDVRKATIQQDVADRAAEQGDTADIDYLGTVDGVAFDGGQAEHHKLVLGNGSFIPGFEEQVVGMMPGEEKDITVTFPEEYHADDLSGKEAVFHVKLHGLTSDLKPELNDDFAADVSEHTTFEAYRNAVVQELTDARDRTADDRLENDLLQQATDAADCDIPDVMVDNEVSSMVRNMQMRMAYQGIKYDDYLKYTGMSEDDVRDMYRSEATANIKTELVIDAIKKAEGIAAGEEDIDAEIRKYAGQIGQEPEAFLKTIADDRRPYFRNMAENRKVIDLLRENADITDRKLSDETLSASDVMEAVEAVGEAAEETLDEVLDNQDEATDDKEEAQPAPKPKTSRKTTKKKEPAAEE